MEMLLISVIVNLGWISIMNFVSAMYSTLDFAYEIYYVLVIGQIGSQGEI